MLPKYSQEESQNAEKTIYSYIVRDYNARGNLDSANGMSMPTDLTDAILYESTFDECTWGTGDWTNLSGNGCRFSSCDFFTNKIHNAALQHTLFNRAVFYNCTLQGSNFAYSTFAWSIINNCPIIGSAFTGTVFNHVLFQNTSITHSNLELCKFQDTEFDNIDLSNVALKYSFFHNASMNNTILPFMQIPYIFGGLKYVLSTKDNISIATTNKKAPFISVKEYKKLLPQLIVFFSGHNEYFPLANCYFANEQYTLAEQANEEGIINSATIHDFRRLYFYCIQATQEIGITRTNRMKLYNTINQLLAVSKLNKAEYLEFRHYFPMIKQLMYDNPNNSPTLLLSFHTNIASDDFDNLGLFMRTLDEIAEKCCVKLDSKRLEIRHNSPNIVDWIPIGHVDQLLQLLQNTWDIMQPVLSNALQNASNVTTIITGLYGLNKMRKKKTNKNQKHFDNLEKKENELQEIEKNNTQNISNDHIETLKLRINLLKKEQLWQKNGANYTRIYKKNSEKIVKEFNDRINSLKCAGVYIDTFEVQLLDDQSDTLDKLYNSNIELI